MSMIKVLVDLVSDVSSLLGSQTANFSLYSHIVKGVAGLSVASFIRTLVLFTRAEPRGPIF